MGAFVVKVLKAVAVLVSAAAFFVLLLVGLLVLIGVALQPEPERVDAESLLVLDLGIEITDRPVREDPGQIFAALAGDEGVEVVSLRTVLASLREAQRDDAVAGLLIRGTFAGGGYANSYAALGEVRRAIAAFGERKPTVALLEGDGLRELYVKSAAEEVIADREAQVDFRGLRAERMYLGNALERLGVGVQTVAFEEYKSAADTFVRGDMSEEERAELERVLGQFWRSLAGQIAEARGVELSKLDELANNELLLDARELEEAGLVDQVLENAEWVERLVELGSWDAEAKQFRGFDFVDYVDLKHPRVGPALRLLGGGNHIGVIYAEGPVVAGEGGEGMVGGARMVRFLRQMRENADVKAVVVRINSPGGSAVAANRIVQEMRRLNEEKPVVVSMGGLAASAGYLMAAPAEEIYVEPTTLTGSIGVILMLPNVEKLAERLSVNFDSVQTHRFGGAFSLSRKKTEAEMEQNREIAKEFYEEFLRAVVEGRDMEMEALRTLAGGRIWSGTAAVTRGLVDAEGGLEAAIQRAADLAGIGDDYELLERPRPQSLEEVIAEELAELRLGRAPTGGTASVWERLRAQAEEFWTRVSSLNDPYGTYAILPYTLRIE